MNKIHVLYSPDGTLPEGCSSKYSPKPGWHAVIPQGVAHWMVNWDWAMWLAGEWVKNFRHDKEFWHG